MAKLSKILKDISKLPEEEQLEVKSWFEEELEETPKVEPKEEPKVEPKKEEPKQEPKVEETPKQEFDFTSFKEELLKEFNGKFEQYESEISKLKEELEETVPKAKGFGAQPKNVPKEEQTFDKQGKDIVTNLNKKF